MEKNILFSIIIPTYNRSKNIELILNTLTHQTYKNFEVIISDDGSTDNTKEVVEKFTNSLNIIYLINENSGGPARPRNLGLKVAKGEWISFLDSDDLWTNDKLEKILEYTHANDFIYHNLYITKKNLTNNVLTKSRQASSNALLDLLVNRNFINNSSVSVRKSIIDKAGPFREEKEYNAIEDYDMWIRISQLTDKFKFIGIPLGNYNIDGMNLTSDFIKRNEKEIFIFNQYINFIPDHLISEAKSKLYWTISINYILDRNLLYLKYMLLVVKYAKPKLKLFSIFSLFFGLIYLRKKFRYA